MKHIDRHQYDDRNMARSIYEGGLKNVFAACHEPLPEKMEELLRQLADSERQHHA